MIFRVICAGYGRPCPAHAWWYSGTPGAPRLRCHVCAHRVRRWCYFDHATECAVCRAPLPIQLLGRPRVVCSDACSRLRRHPPAVVKQEPTMPNERPIHYLTHRAGNSLRVCACGKIPARHTIEPEKASCHDCARHADGLTAAQRDEIWENANDRTGKARRSPFAAAVALERAGAK